MDSNTQRRAGAVGLLYISLLLQFLEGSGGGKKRVKELINLDSALFPVADQLGRSDGP